MLKKVDIIVSCYNEEENIIPFFKKVKVNIPKDKYEFNLLFINDGSIDNSENVIKKLKKEFKNTKYLKISTIKFIKNYGHEAAMCAGLDFSKANYLIFIDADLQNPPKKIPEIMKAFEKGADCVLLKRVKYENVSFFKRFTSRTYYMISKYIFMNKNERDVSDFFAIDNKLAKIIKDKYKTRLRMLRSFVQAETKNKKIINYKTEKRYKGHSKYNYLILTKLAIISELSRFEIFRNLFKTTKNKPVYIIKKEKSK